VAVNAIVERTLLPLRSAAIAKVQRNAAVRSANAPASVLTESAIARTASAPATPPSAAAVSAASVDARRARSALVKADVDAAAATSAAAVGNRRRRLLQQTRHPKPSVLTAKQSRQTECCLLLVRSP